MLAFGFARKVQGASNLDFTANKIDDVYFDGLTPIIKFSLSVQNTSNQVYTIGSIVGNIYANKIKVGQLSFFENITVQPKSQTLLSVECDLDSLGVVNDIVKAFQFKSLTQKIQFSGSANVDGYQIPIDVTYTIGLEQPETT